MSLIFQRPWTRQPQGQVRLASWTARDPSLAVLLPNGGAVAHVGQTGRYLPNGSSLVLQPGQLGQALVGTTSGTNTVQLADNSLANPWNRPSAQFTAFAYVKRTGSPGGSCPFWANCSPSAGPFTAWGLLDNGGILRVECAPGGTYREVAGAAWSGRPEFVAAVYNGATLLVYQNGVQTGSGSFTGNLSYPALSGTGLGNFYDFTGSARSFVGEIYMAGISARAYSPAEIVALSQNPWQIFAPLPRRIWAPAGGGGGVTASPGAGTLTLTGLAPSATQQISVAPGVGALVLTGLAPTVAQTSTVAPGAGALTLSGLAPSVTQAVLVSPGAGALVLLGLAPTISAAEGPAPGAGALLFNGLAPTVTQVVNASPDPGVLSLAGLAPSIAQGANVSPGASALTLSGLTPSVTQDVIVRPDAGVLLFDGLAPSIPGQSATASPDPGSLTLDGLAPTVTVSGQETLLDAKFAARRPNVVMRRLADLEPKEPLPADITNMPDAPEPPEPISSKLARGLDLGELPDGPTPESAAEEQAEVAQRKSAAAAPAPVEGAGSTPALGATDAEPPQEAPQTEPASEGAAEQALARISTELALLAPKLTSAVAAQIDPVLEAVADLRAAVSAVQADLAAERKAQALRERNLKRAKEIADRLLNSD